MTLARVRFVDDEIEEAVDIMTDIKRLDRMSDGLVAVTDEEGYTTVLDAAIASIDFAALTVDLERRCPEE
jgi:hypothetical protein